MQHCDVPRLDIIIDLALTHTGSLTSNLKLTLTTEKNLYTWRPRRFWKLTHRQDA